MTPRHLVGAISLLLGAVLLAGATDWAPGHSVEGAIGLALAIAGTVLVFR